MSIEPHAFYWKKDKRRSLAVYSSWADAVWYEESQGCPELAGRAEYGVGFRDGFVDYVYAGGTGEPPPVPPRHLWNVDFRSEEGHQRAEDWFAGYRHGAQVARDGGYRSLATVRSSILGMEPGGPAGYGDDIWQGRGFDAQGNWPTTEPLPTPEPAPSLPPNTIEAEGEIEPPMDQPAEEPENETPETRPIVPPPPRNLPPTTPRNLAPPDGEEPPAESNILNDRPADVPTDVPTTERETIDQIEPAPLSTPPDATDEPGAEATPEPTTPEPTSSSLRIMERPLIAVKPPRAPRSIAPPPSSNRAKLVGDRSPTHAQSAIRLTAATSTTKPAANEPQTSSIRIRPASGELQGSTSSGPPPIPISTAR